ncbi:MAG: hypothetical protein GF384_00015, partial [Elusimicrobia bacterium]|nr:hypothetical protein [Elusimicrobiota bacterium]
MRNKEIRLLRIGTGSALSDIYRKFRTLDVYVHDRVSDENPFVIRYSTHGTFDGYIIIDDHFLYYEQRFTFPKIISYIRFMLHCVRLCKQHRIT